MKKVVAVSGGVDSVALFSMCLELYAPGDIVVAHFDHGTRDTSRVDAEFVARLAKKYGVQIFSERAELGENISEAGARVARYAFLNKIARSLQISGSTLSNESISAKAQNSQSDDVVAEVEIFTAHHLDDLVESVVINLVRGTGWRGLAALAWRSSDNTDQNKRPGQSSSTPTCIVRRPFLEPEFYRNFFETPPTKSDLVQYAARHQLFFREDPTNNSEIYLRNRIRRILRDYATTCPHEWREIQSRIFRLWKRQVILKQDIDEELNSILPDDGIYERSWFDDLDDSVALEMLKEATHATAPQLVMFLDAIRNYEPGKSFNLPDDKLVKFSRDYFRLK